MSTPNKFGLTRDIPDPIARAIRQRCGFGCVVCGNALYQYEHLDPLFVDAKHHDPSAIVLLCGGCHAKVTRGHLSKATVAEFAKNPKAIQRGYSFDSFDIGNGHPRVTIGQLTATQTPDILRVYGVSLLSVAPPEAPGGPFRLSALLTDSDGRVVVQIVHNEWRAQQSNWDVEIVGRRITFRRAHRDICLVIRTDPTIGIVVERIQMRFINVHVRASQLWFEVSVPYLGTLRTKQLRIDKCESAININSLGMTIGSGCKEGSVSLEHATIGPSAA